MQAVFTGSKYGIGHRGCRGGSRDCGGYHDANDCADLATPIAYQLLTITMTKWCLADFRRSGSSRAGRTILRWCWRASSQYRIRPRPTRSKFEGRRSREQALLVDDLDRRSYVDAVV